MIGLMDGVRLFNDLHMKPVAPRLTIYIAQVKLIYRTLFIFVVFTVTILFCLAFTVLWESDAIKIKKILNDDTLVSGNNTDLELLNYNNIYNFLQDETRNKYF